MQEKVKQFIYFVVGVISILLVAPFVGLIPGMFDVFASIVPPDDGVQFAFPTSFVGIAQLVAFIAMQFYFWVGGFGRGAVEMIVAIYSKATGNKIEPEKPKVAASTPLKAVGFVTVDKFQALVKHYNEQVESLNKRLTALEPVPVPEPTVEELKERIKELEAAKKPATRRAAS